MRIGNREKIVVGVIAAVGTIAALHFTIFHKSARAFRSAKENYEAEKSKLESQGSPKAWADINRFEYQTINYEISFYELLNKSGVEIPSEFAALAGEAVGDGAKLLELQLGLSWDILHDLQEMSRKPNGTRLTFLGSNRSWFILDRLPDSVTQGATEVSDLVRRLQDTNELIKSAPEESRLLESKEQEYEFQLRQFGLDVNRRELMKDYFGELPALLYTYNRIDIVMQAVPKNELGIQTDEEYTQRLKDLFRVEWANKDDGFSPYKQMKALKEFCELANKHGIREIGQVKMWENTPLRWPPKEEAAIQQDAANVTGSFYSAGSSNAGGQRNQAGAEDNRPQIANAVPIELMFTGSNTAVMSFLYEISNGPDHYEVEFVDIQSVTGQEDLVQVRAVIKVIAYYNNILLTEDDIVKKLSDLESEKSALAIKPGASELAAEEGYTPEKSENP